MIRIFDGNNYYRRKLEANPTGMTTREVLTDTLNCSDVQIWVWDGEHGNAKRRELYPDYKAHRKIVRKDIYAGFDTVQNVLSHTGAFQISVPGYEGDDVIATLARRYAQAGNDVAIYSTDYDFVQLTGEFPNRVFCGARLKAHISRDLVRHYKAWVGDPSDNIRGVPGFGDITWQRTDKEEIKRFTVAVLEYAASCYDAGMGSTTTAGAASNSSTSVGNVRSTVRGGSSGSDTSSRDGDGSSRELHRSGRRLECFRTYQSDFSTKVIDWLSVPENAQLFKTYWDIVGFYDVPDILIDEHLRVGVENYDAADRYLKQWFL